MANNTQPLTIGTKYVYTDKRDNWLCEPVGIEFTANAYAAIRMFESYEISISDVLSMTMETLTSIGSKLR